MLYVYKHAGTVCVLKVRTAATVYLRCHILPPDLLQAAHTCKHTLLSPTLCDKPALMWGINKEILWNGLSLITSAVYRSVCNRKTEGGRNGCMPLNI